MKKLVLLLLIFILFILAGCSQDRVLTSDVDGVLQLDPDRSKGIVTEDTEHQSSSTPETDSENSQPDSANADVTYVRAVQAQDGTWTFHVSIFHPDTGWEDYADGWDVVSPDGSVLKVNQGDPFTRLLLHPHENEQPFTRSQSSIIIPPGTEWVRVRAHDLVAGYGGVEIMVDLNRESGPGYQVDRK